MYSPRVPLVPFPTCGPASVLLGGGARPPTPPLVGGRRQACRARIAWYANYAGTFLIGIWGYEQEGQQQRCRDLFAPS